MSPSLFISYMNRLDGLLKPRFVVQDPSLLSFAEKDYNYSLKRFSAEGIKYLTVTLPSLRKAVDLSFSTGHIEVPNSFKCVKGTGIPAFLSSHFRKIYDESGSLLPKPYVARIKHVRQILEAFYKLELPYSRDIESSTLENFVNNEEKVVSFLNTSELWRTPDDLKVISGAALLCRYVFQEFDPKDIHPRHGPGSLATGEKGEEKWLTSRLYNQIHQVFPYYKYFYHSTDMLGDLAGQYRSLERLPKGSSKIVLVPKDSRGPRIITMEPLEYMFLQQGLGRKIMQRLETSPLTRGRINFTDQKVNQELARKGSLTGEWATLDMKDASDLLSVDVVKLVFRLKPTILKCLLALRTTDTILPDKREVSLRKFAGMGSALCFPVESFIFWALSVSALAHAKGIELQDASALVYVYGDDIIVPTEYAEVVIHELSAVGLRVNTEKSYYTGVFRESCGADWYYSYDVTPTRFRKPFPESSDDGTGLAAWVSYANMFMAKGYHMLASSIFTDLEHIFGFIPYGIKTSPFPCKVVDDPNAAEILNKDNHVRWRVSKDYQRIEFRVKTLTSLKVDSTLDSWARFNRNILSGTGDEPSIYTVPRATKVVRGWMAV